MTKPLAVLSPIIISLGDLSKAFDLTEILLKISSEEVLSGSWKAGAFHLINGRASIASSRLLLNG